MKHQRASHWSVVKGHGVARRYVCQVRKGNIKVCLPNLRASFVLMVSGGQVGEDVTRPQDQESGMEEKHWAIWLRDLRVGPRHVRRAKSTHRVHWRQHGDWAQR